MQGMVGMSLLTTDVKINPSGTDVKGAEDKFLSWGRSAAMPPHWRRCWSAGLATGAAHVPGIKRPHCASPLLLHHPCKEWLDGSIYMLDPESAPSFHFLHPSWDAISSLANTGLVLRCFSKEHLTEPVKNFNFLSCSKMHLWCFSSKFKRVFN